MVVLLVSMFPPMSVLTFRCDFIIHASACDAITIFRFFQRRFAAIVNNFGCCLVWSVVNNNLPLAKRAGARFPQFPLV